MKRLAFILTVFLLCQYCKKEPLLLKVGNFQFEQIANLPAILNESSGLENAGTNEFWSHNDKGGSAELYRFDTLGILNQTLRITNASNIDWEDMTIDAEGNIYVGDFGNNDNERSDLKIYKIAAADIDQNNNEVTAEVIRFSFPEQIAFPPPDENLVFDVESMFAKGSKLYLITRDRSKPFIGKSNLYRLPNTPGEYDAINMDAVLTNLIKEKGQITAADLSPDGRNMAMISNTSIWIYQHINDDQFFDGNLLQLDLPIELDMEGLVFADDCTIYMTNEKGPNEPAILYRIKICP